MTEFFLNWNCFVTKNGTYFSKSIFECEHNEVHVVNADFNYESVQRIPIYLKKKKKIFATYVLDAYLRNLH